MKTKLPFYTEEEILWLATCDGIGQREKRKTLAAIQARHVTETAGLVEALDFMFRLHDSATGGKPHGMDAREQIAGLTKHRAALAAAKQS